MAASKPTTYYPQNQWENDMYGLYRHDGWFRKTLIMTSHDRVKLKFLAWQFTMEYLLKFSVKKI